VEASEDSGIVAFTSEWVAASMLAEDGTVEDGLATPDFPFTKQQVATSPIHTTGVSAQGWTFSRAILYLADSASAQADTVMVPVATARSVTFTVNNNLVPKAQRVKTILGTDDCPVNTFVVTGIREGTQEISGTMVIDYVDDTNWTRLQDDSILVMALLARHPQSGVFGLTAIGTIGTNDLDFGHTFTIDAGAGEYCGALTPANNDFMLAQFGAFMLENQDPGGTAGGSPGPPGDVSVLDYEQDVGLVSSGLTTLNFSNVSTPFWPTVGTQFGSLAAADYVLYDTAFGIRHRWSVRHRVCCDHLDHGSSVSPRATSNRYTRVREEGQGYGQASSLTPHALAYNTFSVRKSRPLSDPGELGHGTQTRNVQITSPMVRDGRYGVIPQGAASVAMYSGDSQRAFFNTLLQRKFTIPPNNNTGGFSKRGYADLKSWSFDTVGPNTHESWEVRGCKCVGFQFTTQRFGSLGHQIRLAAQYAAANEVASSWDGTADANQLFSRVAPGRHLLESSVIRVRETSLGDVEGDLGSTRITTPTNLAVSCRRQTPPRPAKGASDDSSIATDQEPVIELETWTVRVAAETWDTGDGVMRGLVDKAISDDVRPKRYNVRIDLGINDNIIYVDRGNVDELPTIRTIQSILSTRLTSTGCTPKTSVLICTRSTRRRNTTRSCIKASLGNSVRRPQPAKVVTL
jgi:hypothetical protein